MSLLIKAEKREEKGRATDVLRVEGKVPGILYGFDTDPINIVVDRNELKKIHGDVGGSMVVTLDIAGSENNVLIQDVQRDALTDFLTHVDFRKIDMKKEVETSIPIALQGESVAVKELGGTLIQALDSVDVKVLPTALVKELVIDATELKTFDDVIRVSDLSVPEGMEILTDMNRSIATVQPPRTEQEMEALDETVETDVGDVEVSTEKEEGEEGGEAKGAEEEKKSE